MVCMYNRPFGLVQFGFGFQAGERLSDKSQQ
jgi:hypothetical protein